MQQARQVVSWVSEELLHMWVLLLSKWRVVYRCLAGDAYSLLCILPLRSTLLLCVMIFLTAGYGLLKVGPLMAS